MPSLLSEEQQLADALAAFRYSLNLDDDWDKNYLEHFASAGITSINDLASSARDGTINLDLDFLAEIAPHERLSEDLILRLRFFLPGPVGIRCFRLAQKAAEKVEFGTADAKYVHRPEDGNKGEEKWVIKNGGTDWKLHVDCAGFVRSTVKHVLSHIVTTDNTFTDTMPISLSDRSFMRAKDFYRYFESITVSVTDPPSLQNNIDVQWRLIRDLRMVISGDIIVYRPKGNAAGGASFTSNDRSSLKNVLKAVKTAQLWREEDDQLRPKGLLITRNVMRDKRIKPWMEAVLLKLRQDYNITTVKGLRNLLTLGEVEEDEKLFTPETIQLMLECVETSENNTGHIVFCAGQPVLLEEKDVGWIYRVPVVHSTKYGKVDENGVKMEGVQMHYRRFLLTRETGRWTRENKLRLKSPPEAWTATTTPIRNGGGSHVRNSSGQVGYTTDEDDGLVEGPDDDPEDAVSGDDPAEEEGDDVSGLGDVEILAARMAI